MRALRRFLEEMAAMRGDMSAMRGDFLEEMAAMRGDMGAMRSDFLEAMAASRGEMAATRDEVRALHEENAQTLRFMGEVIRRNERAFVEFRDELRESRAETRAQTRAIFALIDRLQGGGAAA